MSSQYFPPYGSDIRVELGLSIYATKIDLKNVTHVEVSSFATKTNLASLKSEVDKLDIPKLSTVPADLAKLSNKVANDLVEETDFNVLEKKVTDNKTAQDNLQTTVLILGRGLVQGLNGKTLYAEKIYPTNFTVVNKKFV